MLEDIRRKIIEKRLRQLAAADDSLEAPLRELTELVGPDLTLAQIAAVAAHVKIKAKSMGDASPKNLITEFVSGIAEKCSIKSLSAFGEALRFPFVPRSDPFLSPGAAFEYTNPAKNTWRDFRFRFFDENVHLVGDDPNLVNGLILDAIDKKTERFREVPYYLAKGYKNFTIVERDKKAWAAVEAEARRIEIKAKYGDLIQVAPTLTDPFGLLFLDFTGPAGPDKMKILELLPTTDSALVFLTQSLKREGPKAKKMLATLAEDHIDDSEQRSAILSGKAASRFELEAAKHSSTSGLPSLKDQRFHALDHATGVLSTRRPGSEAQKLACDCADLLLRFIERRACPTQNFDSLKEFLLRPTGSEPGILNLRLAHAADLRNRMDQSILSSHLLSTLEKYRCQFLFDLSKTHSSLYLHLYHYPPEALLDGKLTSKEVMVSYPSPKGTGYITKFSHVIRETSVHPAFNEYAPLLAAHMIAIKAFMMENDIPDLIGLKASDLFSFKSSTGGEKPIGGKLFPQDMIVFKVANTEIGRCPVGPLIDAATQYVEKVLRIYESWQECSKNERYEIFPDGKIVRVKPDTA